MSSNNTTDTTTTPLVEKTPEDTINELVATIKTLTAELDRYKAKDDQQKIIDQLGTIAKELRIPEAVIVHDLPRYLPDFILKDGKVVARADESQDVRQVLTALQKERPHWLPLSQGAGNEPMRATHNANTYAAMVERQGKEWFDHN